MDYFYCDFSLKKENKLQIILTSQLDASIYQKELSNEDKKIHEGLNFFETIEDIY